MKKIINIAIIFSMIFYFMPLKTESAMESALSEMSSAVMISMDFKDANLKDVLKVLSVQSGLNFIASDVIKERTITLYLNNVGVDEAIDQIFKANNLTYDFDSESNIFIVKELGRPLIETTTKVYYLKNARTISGRLSKEIDYKTDPQSSATTDEASSGSTSTSENKEEEWNITKIVRKNLTENGKVVEDARTNSLVVTDTPMNISRIDQLIAALDRSVPQVLIEVEMLDTTKQAIDQLGFQWPANLMNLAAASRGGMGFPFRSMIQGGSKFSDVTQIVAGTLSMGTINAAGTTIALEFLRTRTDTKYLARPKILTLSNETAEIKISTDEAIGVISTTSTTGAVGTVTQEAERAETGVFLRVTPQVNLETGEITMYVEPTVKEARASNITIITAGGVQQVRDPETRGTKSVLCIKDGETIVIGGLLRKNSQETVRKLPFFGDIPLIGALFRHKTSSPAGINDRELIVFITPKIIKSNTELAQVETVSTPITNVLAEREQDPIAVQQRKNTIQTTLQRYDR